MKIRYLMIAFAAAVACLFATAASSYASTGSAAAAETGIVQVQSSGHVVNHVVSATLAKKINSGDWKDLTEQQLASAGIHPGMTPAGATITAGVRPASVTQTNSVTPNTVIPDTGSGCNFSAYDSMCIYVFGKGLHVDDWDTSVSNYFATYKCSYAGYWVAGVLTGTSNVVCGNGDFWAYSSPLRYYINGTQLCNTWLNWAGKPCLVVHS